MKTHQALTLRFYSKNKLQNYLYRGKMRYFIEFRKQCERFCRTNETTPDRETVETVCAEKVIVKAQDYSFSKN